MPGQSPADVIRDQLAQYLGPFTAKNAVRLYAKQALATDEDGVTLAEVPRLLEALGPTLRTLLGRDTAERLIADLQRDLAC